MSTRHTLSVCLSIGELELLERRALEQGVSKGHYLRHMAMLGDPEAEVVFPDRQCSACPHDEGRFTEPVMARFTTKQYKALRQVKRKDEGIGPLIRRLVVERLSQLEKVT